MTGAYKKLLSPLTMFKPTAALELGSRDAKDAKWLADEYNVPVVCWEANPPSIEVCEFVIGDREDITLVPKAAWSESGPLKFFPVINGNIGASSAFKADPAYPYERRYQQKEIEVEAQRVADWYDENPEHDRPNLLCIDLQGAEIEALKGCVGILQDVEVIVTEGQYRRLYHDTPLISDIETYLNEHDFHMVTGNKVNDWFGDFLFVKGLAWAVALEAVFHPSH
jgi:FkbM family methyltransferase